MDTDVVWHNRAPAAPLRGLIDGYQGYRIVGQPPALHRGLPSRHMTFIISIGAPINVVQQTSPWQPPEQYRVVVSGLQATAAMIAHDGIQEGVLIELSPLGCAALFRMPAGELWDLSAEASTVVGRAGDELWERVQLAGSWTERFQACYDVLVGWLRESGTSHAVAGAWRAIVASSGGVSVEDLAGRAGYTRQHLARLFRRELGLGPKLASRVVRFDRAARMLRSTSTPPAPSTPSMSLAAVAAACGYADQAHLCRDVADLAGCTPGDLLAGDIPIVQDVGDVVM